MTPKWSIKFVVKGLLIHSCVYLIEYLLKRNGVSPYTDSKIRLVSMSLTFYFTIIFFIWEFLIWNKKGFPDWRSPLYVFCLVVIIAFANGLWGTYEFDMLIVTFRLMFKPKRVKFLYEASLGEDKVTTWFQTR